MNLVGGSGGSDGCAEYRRCLVILGIRRSGSLGGRVVLLGSGDVCDMCLKLGGREEGDGHVILLRERSVIEDYEILECSVCDIAELSRWFGEFDVDVKGSLGCEVVIRLSLFCNFHFSTDLSHNTVFVLSS